MKKTLAFLLLFLCQLSMQAQVLRPITWQADVRPAAVHLSDTVELIFSAKIQAGWYLYSSDFDANLGPIVTSISLEKHPSFEQIGTLKAIKPKKKFDELWGGEYTYFVEKAEFRQKIKILSSKPRIKASARYQVCTDADGKCISLENDFTLDQITVIADASSSLTTDYQEVEAKKEDSTAATAALTQSSQVTQNTVPLTTATEEESLFAFMLYAFLFGLAAIFTPCVFPMIPLTVSFFTKKSSVLKAIWYGASIILIYTAIGAILAPLAGPAMANVISTHWLPNALFFIIFIAFALSFFGMFEIVLPSNFINQIDAQSDRGGWIGVFFMAFTLVLVSFSCTGPIVGSILVASAGGQLVKPIAGMFAFSLAFALPFSLFALFPQWLAKLPKSGGWLNSVKVTLGFIELALAFKFLSMIDLVYHWELFDRDVNIAIWVAISGLMGLYYLGKLRLPHDEETQFVSVPKLLLALLCFSFMIYLLPGMFGAPLKALSGILPPQNRHSFDLHQITNLQKPQNQLIAKHQDKFRFPHGLQGYFDYQEALAAAKAAKKPLFIDFTGHGCANCRKMEDNVWIAPAVYQKLKDEFVLVALYVDDPTELPEKEWITSSYDGKIKKTIGGINADLQISRFQNNAQPFYVLLDTNGELLVSPIGYQADSQIFNTFLEEGLKAFRAKN